MSSPRPSSRTSPNPSDTTAHKQRFGLNLSEVRVPDRRPVSLRKYRGYPGAEPQKVGSFRKYRGYPGAEPQEGGHRAKLFVALMFAAILGTLVTTTRPAAAQQGRLVFVGKTSNFPGTFQFLVTCDGPTTATGGITITPEDASSSNVVTTILTGRVSGTNCVLTEPGLDTSLWQIEIREPNGVPKEEGLYFNVRNIRRASTLVISKTSVGPAGSVGTFPIRLECTGVPFNPGGDANLTTITPGVAVSTNIIPLPLGITSCTATEPDLDTTKWTAINPVTINIVGGANTISVTNTRKTKSGFINKDFKIGHGLPLGNLASNSSFSFTVTCGTLADGNLQTFRPVITNPTFADPAKLEFDIEFGPIFDESTCTETEDDPGPLWIPTTRFQEGVKIFVNERKTSSQTITKTLDSPADTPLTFEFRLNGCNNPTTAVNNTVSISIPQGSTGPVTSAEIWAPTETTCTVVEVPGNGYLIPEAQTMTWGNTNGGITVLNVRQIPDFSVTKTASASSVLSGTPVTYTYNVKNIGNVDLTIKRIVDDKCLSVSYLDGDTDNDRVLDKTETWNYTCTQTLRQSDTTPGTNNVDNIVTVDARHVGENEEDAIELTRKTTARVAILQPAPTTTTTTPATTTTSAPVIALLFPTIPTVATIAPTVAPTVQPTVQPTPTTTAAPVTIPAVILAASVPTTEAPNVEAIQVTQEPAYTGSSTNTLTLLALVALTLGSAIVALCRRLRKQHS